MVFRKFSGGCILAVSACLALAMLLTPTRAKAELTGPDWANASLKFELVGDYAYRDGEEYITLNNILSEKITADVNDGSFASQRLTQRTYYVYPTNVGYFSGSYALPLGETRWQTISLGTFRSSGFYGNPADAGALVFVNGATPYYAGPMSLHYVADWRAMFSKISANYQGNVTRSVADSFNIDSTPVLKKSDGTPLPITTKAAAAFSRNGQWLYLNTDIGQLRAHIPDLSYQYLAPRLITNYAVYSAVSNDGRFAVAGANDQPLTIYDTSSCSAGSVGCVKRDLYAYVKNEYAKTLPAGVRLGYFSVVGVKFLDTSRVEAYFWTTWSDGTTKYVKVTIGVEAGVQPVRYLTLGDSFSSGEGAGSYYDATDFYENDSNYNKCHQSHLAYSEVLNSALRPDWYDSVACSGAVMKDVVYPALKSSDYFLKASQSKFPVYGPDDLERQLYIDTQLAYKIANVNPGYVPQLTILQNESPTVSTISIGGNDIGFGDVVKACVLQPICYASRDDRELLADLIDQQIPKLVRTYQTIKLNMSGPDPHLYVVGYPKIVNDQGFCASFMDTTERGFANSLVDYLNSAIQIAASEAGARFVDVSDAFVDYVGGRDYRLCGNAQPAVNGFVADERNASSNQPIERDLSGSYHPNALGHTLLANRIRLYTNDLTRQMPGLSVSSDRPSADLYRRLVGDNLDDIHARTRIIPDIVWNPIVTKQDTIGVTFQVDPVSSAPVYGGSVTVQLHSTPVTLGALSIGPDGKATGSFAIPSGVEPGIHTVHLLYKDVSGQDHDDIAHIWIQASADDFDGDGIVNSDEQCVVGGLLGIDWDKDGIDDACDPEIVEKPAATPEPPLQTIEENPVDVPIEFAPVPEDSDPIPEITPPTGSEAQDVDIKTGGSTELPLQPVATPVENPVIQPVSQQGSVQSADGEYIFANHPDFAPVAAVNPTASENTNRTTQVLGEDKILPINPENLPRMPAEYETINWAPWVTTLVTVGLLSTTWRVLRRKRISNHKPKR